MLRVEALDAGDGLAYVAYVRRFVSLAAMSSSKCFSRLWVISQRLCCAISASIRFFGMTDGGFLPFAFCASNFFCSRA